VEERRKRGGWELRVWGKVWWGKGPFDFPPDFRRGSDGENSREVRKGGRAQ